MEIVCGIYKITSPSGKIYIGQSLDIYRRWKHYTKMRCSDQPKVYNSFLKYGVENHVFEIVLKCDEFQLNQMEEEYMNLYNCMDSKSGLNIKGAGSNGRHSEETKRKLSTILKGRIVSAETRKKISDFAKTRVGEKNPMYGNGWRVSGERSGLYGKKKSEEVTNKNRQSNIITSAKIRSSKEYNSIEQRNKRSNACKGRIHSEEARQKLKESNVSAWAKIVSSPEFNSKEAIEKRKNRVREGCRKMKENPEHYSQERKNIRSEARRKSWETRRLNGTHKHSEETKIKMSKLKKEYYENKKNNH